MSLRFGGMRTCLRVRSSHHRPAADTQRQHRHGHRPSPLWDFNQPGLSEVRFRSALAQASGDDALILQTQIARSYGLRS